MKKAKSKKLPDIHKEKVDPRKAIALRKVGIRELRIPLKVLSKDGGTQDVIANISAYCSLGKNDKGINMSRLPEILHDHLEKEVGLNFINHVLKRIKERMNSNAAYLKLRFPYLIKKEAPISKKMGFVYYDCVLEGKMYKNFHKYFLTVIVQYISTCPCSKRLSMHLEETRKVRGAPHQQRAYATVTVQYTPRKLVYIEDLINWIESALVTVPYTIVKRPDEQELARLSWKYTHFVEDAARNIIAELNSHKEVLDWVVVVDSEESIHHHTATCIVPKGVRGGLK